MTIKETPNKIKAVLRVTATAEFFDDEASEETVRCLIEQDLEDAGFDVDVALLKEQDNCENCAIAIEDRQPVVRCKDCKHAVLTYDGEAKYCTFWQDDGDGGYGGDPLYLDGDFYCAAGERR